jgi:hypothetical protein
MLEVNASDATISACNHHCLSLWSPSHLCFVFKNFRYGRLDYMYYMLLCVIVVVTERNGRRQDGTGKLNISIIHIALYTHKW